MTALACGLRHFCTYREGKSDIDYRDDCVYKYGHTADVTLSNLVGTGLPAFTFDAPVLSAVGLNIPKLGPTTLEVRGLQFGSVNFTPTAAVASFDPCRTLSWTSLSSLRCTLMGEKTPFSHPEPGPYRTLT